MALIGLVVGCNGDERQEVVPSRVVALITIDTWRLDHFSETHTSNLWQLAVEGERFSNAWSPIGLTSPAHATMFTGLMPWEHGMEGNNHHGYVLNESVPVLADRFVGFRTGAFVSAWPAGPDGGLGRGWQTFSGPASGERSGEIAVSEALEWLETEGDSLLWVHLYEPHGPYQGVGESDEERYAEEVHRADVYLEPLLAALVERNATIVVAGDHGEVHREEKCGWQHERSISEVVLRVPMFRWTPSRLGQLREEWVGLSDVPLLLSGEDPPARSHWLAESGMCEEGCSAGCAPAGLIGRDRVVFGPEGRHVIRPGKGAWTEGVVSPQLMELVRSIPETQAPTQPADASSLEALGYQEGVGAQ